MIKPRRWASENVFRCLGSWLVEKWREESITWHWRSSPYLFSFFVARQWYFEILIGRKSCCITWATKRNMQKLAPLQARKPSENDSTDRSRRWVVSFRHRIIVCFDYCQCISQDIQVARATKPITDFSWHITEYPNHLNRLTILPLRHIWYATELA